MTYMWKYDLSEYRFQSDDPKVIEKMKRRPKFKLVGCGDVMICQKSCKALRDAKKLLSTLTSGKVKSDTLEGVYVA